MYVAIITRYVYGTSGTELPPPVIHIERYAYLSKKGETKDQFNERIKGIVLPLREKSRNTKPPDYGQNDGFDWQISEVREIA